MSLTKPTGIMFNADRDTHVANGTFVHGTMITNNNIYGPGCEGPWGRFLQRTCANAIHDSDELVRQGICIDNTREAVLKLLHEHLSSTSPKSPDFLWLNGPAGAGKSAIARTVAQSTHEAETLLGSFFFYNSDKTRSTIDPLIPTLAYQIHRRFFQVRPYIEEAIERDPHIFTKATSAQADALIIRPLKQALATTSSPIPTPFGILVDGLDECANSERQTEVINVLVGVVAKIRHSTRLRAKLVVFSRPERWIRSCVSRWEGDGTARSVALDKDLTTRRDMELYYKTHFTAIREYHPMGPSLDTDWPSSEQMNTLVDITDDNFAFAETIRIFVSNPHEDPKTQLEIALGTPRPNQASPHEHIDQLYATIFSRIPEHTLPQTLRIIGSFLVSSPCALHPSPPLINLVFSLKRGEIHKTFFHLESLFDLGNQGSSWIRVHHKSVADFLFNPSRSKEYGLFIDQDEILEYIRTSVCSVFLRQEPPESDGLTMFVQYLERLKRHPDDVFPSHWTLDPSTSNFDRTRSVPTPSKWAPWALVVGSQYQKLPILRNLVVPSLSNYAQQMCANAGPNRLSKALAAYDASAFGRICLVLAGQALWQMCHEQSEFFYQAFVRHAVRSQTLLLGMDRTVGWNLAACDPNNLASAVIYFLAQPSSYISNIRKQVVNDALDPNWTTSRLGMLRPWHESGHHSTDDPWEHAAREETVEVESESQLRCEMCLEVLDVCKAEVIRECLRWAVPDRVFYQNVLDHVRARPLLWNHPNLFFLWTQGIKIHKQLIDSDPQLASIANSVCKRKGVIFRSCKKRKQDLVSDGWEDGCATSVVSFPSSRACIPFLPSDRHAVMVSRRRVAWESGVELPEVAYT